MYRVLIADDEPIERQVVGKKIRKHFKDQLEIIEAVNGREAVELFDKHGCQIALLDIEMPGMNGLEAAERIREKDKTCSIIFLTAFDEFNYAKRAILIHALDYLLKPGTDEELIAVLEEAIHIADMRAAVDLEISRKASAKKTGKKDASIDWHTVKNQKEIEQLPENMRIKAGTRMIRAFIEDHYREDISLQDVAGAMNYSDAYFCKLFKQCFDKSFIVYLSEFRVEKAKKMLEDIVISVRDISAEVGYRDSNYFAKVFKRVTGVTPSEYRLKMQKKED